MDNLRIDSHKLIFHVARVNDWLHGKTVYPLYLEIGLYGGCNHRCIFCAFDYLDYAPQIQDERCLKRFLGEAARRGVKSVLYSGEGEPLLHPAAPQIIAFTKKAGLDAALVTNGVLFTPAKAKALLKNLTWVKFSIDAATRNTYAAIHGTTLEDFDRTLGNIKEALRMRNRYGYACTIGAQFLLMPQNQKEALPFARRMKRLGLDYAVVKPYCQHPESFHSLKGRFDYKHFFPLEEKLSGISSRRFSAVFRRNAMQKVKGPKPYRRCFGLDFAAHITAKGDVYPCNVFVGREQFIYGNICRDPFRKIWEGRQRAQVLKKIERSWDLSRCRDVCRLDEINRYLWEIRNPGRHVNFI